MADHLRVSQLVCRIHRRTAVDVLVGGVVIQYGHGHLRRESLKIEIASAESAVAGKRGLFHRIKGEWNAAGIRPSRNHRDDDDLPITRELLDGNDLLGQQIGDDDGLELIVRCAQAIELRIDVAVGYTLLPLLKIGVRQVRVIDPCLLLAIEDDDAYLVGDKRLWLWPLHDIAQEIDRPFSDVFPARVERRGENDRRKNKGAMDRMRPHGQNLAIADSETTVCLDERSKAA